MYILSWTLPSGVPIKFSLVITHTPHRPEPPCQPVVVKWIPDWVAWRHQLTGLTPSAARSPNIAPIKPNHLRAAHSIGCPMIVLLELCVPMWYKLSNLWCQQWVSISVCRIRRVVQATLPIHTLPYWWANIVTWTSVTPIESDWKVCQAV